MNIGLWAVQGAERRSRKAPLAADGLLLGAAASNMGSLAGLGFRVPDILSRKSFNSNSPKQDRLKQP